MTIQSHVVQQSKQGHLVIVVGPSGAGKDSLIDHARAALEGDGRIGFVRRVITRPEGSGGENHEAATEEAFAAMAGAGRFAVTWQAHGLHYGIPAATHLSLAEGKVMLVNGSRNALDDFEAAFGSVHVVLVTARKDVLAQRLAARGRESLAEITERLSRQTDADMPAAALTIDNNGRLEEAGDRLVAFLTALAG